MRGAFFFVAGLAFLFLAKSKNVISGYTSPKPFRLSQVDRCVTYDMRVVDEWLDHLGRYLNTDGTLAIKDKDVLELGPGSDLGVGLYLLSQGANTYSACDVNGLALQVPDAFYEALLSELRCRNPADGADQLEDELSRSRAGESSRLNYVVREDFDLVSAFGIGAVDLVVSQAAFEHFDDVDSTVEGLSRVCRPGAVIVAEIDLTTHSRWIRDKDPNNIYRYPRWLYRAFWFRGAPSRLRPRHYVEAFERHGWHDISVVPLATLDAPPSGAMSREFREPDAEMSLLSVVLCARRGTALEQ